METDDLGDLLDIKELDRDLYEAPAFRDRDRPHLFGGQVAAQALRAAILSVAPDRQPHSLHGYFLRSGTAGRSFVLQVYRDRDGRSFSSRRVLAIQNGEVLFSAAASFHVAEPSPEYQVPMALDVPDPDGSSFAIFGGPTQFFDIRGEPSTVGHGERRFTKRLWARSRVELPDDPGTHACALTYVTDIGSGFAELGIDGLAPAGPSLDHCIWFHQPIRLDEWVLVDLWPLRASGSTGTYMGAVHDRQGALGCMLAQEALLRPRRDLALGGELSSSGQSES
jgi:acyl-CoA thioesterase II